MKSSKNEKFGETFQFFPWKKSHSAEKVKRERGLFMLVERLSEITTM